MTAELEHELERRIRACPQGKFARDVVNEMLAEGLIQNKKQAWATLDKWARKGRWEWGCNFDLGWFIPEK